jgi:hypothetical protein
MTIHPCPEKWSGMIAPSFVSTPSCLMLVVWKWTLELLPFVYTPFCSFWVVWEQPLEFLFFALGCSFSVLVFFYFLCFS